MQKLLIRALRRLLVMLTAAMAAHPAWSGDLAAPGPTNQVLTTRLEGYPHAIDVYQTVGATQAIVVLHGGGGSKTGIASQLGMNSNPDQATVDTVNWAWLEANKVMLVLPQGQHVKAEPNADTWRNHAMDSGEDDLAFLQALAARLRASASLGKITLMGHSMGGVMANRMACESAATFDAYVSIAGPASSAYNHPDTPCAPRPAPQPYLGIIGDQDSVMQDIGQWTAATWTVNPLLVLSARRAWDNDVVIGEFHQQQARAAGMCGEALDEQGFKHQGHVDTWSNCRGRLQLKRVLGAEHDVQSIDLRMGTNSSTDVMDTVMRFLSRQAR